MMEKNNKQNYIMAIAETKSISIAAEQLGISQPALSTHLKKLENELGVKLFDRSRQPLELTEAGRTYIDFAERNEALQKELAQNLSDINGLHTGKVTVGGASFFNIAYLPKTMARFVKEHPGVSVSIVDGKVPELVTMAQKGQLDLFITPVAYEPERFIYEELLEEKIYLAVPEEWDVNDALMEKAVSGKLIKEGVCTDARTLTRDEFLKLCENTFVVLKPDQDIGRKMRALLEKYDCRPAHTITAEQTMTSLNLTLGGVGVSLITESSIRNCSLTKLPKLYLADSDICTRKMYVAYSRHKYLSQASKEFIRVMKESN